VLNSTNSGALMPAFDTQTIGNALGWGLVFDTPNAFVWEIGHESVFTGKMAELAKRQMRKKIPELELALEGRVEEHHRFLLRVQLRRLQAVEEDLGVLEHRIQEKLKPYAAELTLLDEIPGVDWKLAAGIIAEMGVDMSVFGNVSQLASWAGICPGNNESGGKRKSSRIPKGNVYLKTALVEA
jgi:transposase